MKITKKYLAIAIILVLLGSVLVPISTAGSSPHVKGFDKGASSSTVKPMKKTTFVNHNEKSTIDDYAYLASVPTSVFKDKNKLISHPLLFYQDETKITEKEEKSLNTRKGLNYFMDDWMSYCNGKIDKMTLINVPESKVNQWPARKITTINGENPYKLSSEIALNDWSYSKEAVISVLDEQVEKTKETTEGKIEGELPADIKIENKKIKAKQPVVGTGATYQTFNINEPYKYIVSKLTWDTSIDLDLQLYDDQLGMVDASANTFKTPTNIEACGSYINNYGKWETSISAVPKKSMTPTSPGKMEKTFEEEFKETSLLSSFLNKEEEGPIVNITLYPGKDIEIPEPTPYGCRNVNLTLSWENPNIQLGFTVLDPSGNEVMCSLDKEDIIKGDTNNKKETTLNLSMLGECQKGENYSISIFSLDEIYHPVEYEFQYEWEQKVSKKKSESLSSATEGAILASTLNAPLLYTSQSKIPKEIKDTLYTLGVEKIHLVDIGHHISKKARKELETTASLEKHYTKLTDIYSDIKKKNGNNNDLVFTTIEPWKEWLVEERAPNRQTKASLFVGPAAYIAAHHGTPAIITDMHPHLSQASVYPKEFWLKNAANRLKLVSSGRMVFTGNLVYDFLKDHNLGKIDEEKETIITVAGQFNIGIPWDRCFTGAALPGRFFGSPVDTSYWISRSTFYPALIFENPATNPHGTKVINGSKSEIQKIGGRLKKPIGSPLVITKPSQEKKLQNPIMTTLNCYVYKYNQKGYKHFDYKYSRADEIIPYVTPSPDRIDERVTDKSGTYYPDLSESEVVPYYAKQAGYDTAFATNFSAVVENFNRGILIWADDCHGYFTKSGRVSLWDPKSPYVNEANPWRAYERPMFGPSNLRDFPHWLFHYLVESEDLGIIESEGLANLGKIGQKELFKSFSLLSPEGSTANPDVAVINPDLMKLTKIPLLGGILRTLGVWDAFGVDMHIEEHGLKSLIPILGKQYRTYMDGKVIASGLGGHTTQTWKTGYDFDEKLKNIHSAGIHATSCLPATTFWHLTWIRHGSSYQIVDPWTTTDWCAVWQQSVMKHLAMGDTIGEAYEKGMRATGPEYIVGHWWWDTWENVCFFGDPDLRPYVPSTEYSDANHWEKEDTKPLRFNEDISFDGHKPFGVTKYPHQREPSTLGQYQVVIISVVIIAILALIAIMYARRKKIFR